MEKMRINSETEYERNRVLSGYGPHKMLERIHQKMLAKIAKKEAQEKRLASD